MQRICAFHAVFTSIEPIEAAFNARWPQCSFFHLVDDSLARDLADAGSITNAITTRFLSLANYAIAANANGILYTCSAFGPAIDEVRRQIKIPVVKPNEAMIDEAISTASRLHVLATFEPALKSMIPEIEAAADERSKKVHITSSVVPGAMAHLLAGRRSEHDALILAAANKIENVDVILLAQFAMAHTKRAIEDLVKVPVLTTPESAVDRMRMALLRQ